MTADRPKHVILFLAANPSSTAPLALDEECKAIGNELRQTAERDAFEFRSAWAVDVDEMMRHLNELQPTVIHFSGHGGGALQLRQAAGAHRDVEAPAAGIQVHGDAAAQSVAPAALAEMIRTAAPSARLVVLNACFSDSAADALSRVVDCVVGMRGSIGDHTARMFSVGFYRALGYGRSIGNAVAQARAGLAALRLPDADLPICRTRDGADPDRAYLPGWRAPAAGSGDAAFEANLTRYVAAAITVADLRELIADRLTNWLGDHAFRRFKLDDNWRTRRATDESIDEAFLGIRARGWFGAERCTLEFGLWWRGDGAPVSLYAGLRDVPWAGALRPLAPDTRRDAYGNTAYLSRGATTADATALLDELEAAAEIARAS